MADPLAQLTEILDTVSSAPDDLRAVLDRLDRVCALVDAEPAVSEALEELDRRLQGGQDTLLVRYARARLQEQAGLPAAARGYARVARDLTERQQWPLARSLVLRALDLSANADLAPLLLEISSGLNDPLVYREDLRLAARLAPHSPAVQFAQAQMALQEGHSERASQLAVRALRGFVEAGDSSSAEDALLLCLEVPTASSARDLLSQLPLMVEKGMSSLAETVLDLLDPHFEEFHLGRPLLKTLEATLLRGEAPPALRERYVATVARVRGKAQVVRAAAEETGLTDPTVPFAEALAAFQTALSLARGAVVKHRTWGVGRIRAVTEDNLIIDFAGRRGQTMARSMARRSLTPVPPQSLEAQIFLHGDALRQEAQQDPVALILRVIDEVGGKASSTEIKQWLAGTLVPDSSWPAWWKQAREAAAQDPRIDRTQALQGHYRRAAGERPTVVPLPVLKRQDSLAAAVQMIRRLLSQHPEQSEAARSKYAAIVSDWRQREESPEGRLHAALLLARWSPQDRPALGEEVATLLTASRALNLLPSAAEQQEALELALESPAPEPVLLAALGSRFASVRHEARTRLLAFGAPLGDLLWQYLHSEAASVPVQVEVIRLLLETGAVAQPEREPWALALAVLRALSSATARRDIEALLQLLAAQGGLVALVRGRPCPPALEHQIEESLVRLRAHPRRVRGAADFLEAAGHTALLLHLKEPQPSGDREQLLPERNPQIILMTRATYESKVARRDQLRRELVTEIPRLIAAARALGDLSENADYHAARERQGLAAAEARALDTVLHRARVIEDLPVAGDRAAPGTEVTLCDLTTGEERTVWILGHDDAYHGPEVINYRAPLGQALVGRRPGEEVTVELGGDTLTYRIVAVRKRLPSAPTSGAKRRARRSSD